MRNAQHREASTRRPRRPLRNPPCTRGAVAAGYECQTRGRSGRQGRVSGGGGRGLTDGQKSAPPRPFTAVLVAGGVSHPARRLGVMTTSPTGARLGASDGLRAGLRAIPGTPKTGRLTRQRSMHGAVNWTVPSRRPVHRLPLGALHTESIIHWIHSWRARTAPAGYN